MITIKNINGETLPLLYTDTANSFEVDGTLAHAESAKKPQGAYRIAVKSSVDDAGCNVVITLAGTSATVITGAWMAQGSSEIFILKENDIISVINGKLSVTPMS